MECGESFAGASGERDDLLAFVAVESFLVGGGGAIRLVGAFEDASQFNAKTSGQIVVLGRVCFETWPRAAQDGRRPIVITRNAGLALIGRTDGLIFSGNTSITKQIVNP